MQSGKATQIQLDITSDLQKWRAFLAIAELGSLTRAALFLDSNQSLLSGQLNALGRDGKARLVNRAGRGVAGSATTPIGRGGRGAPGWGPRRAPPRRRWCAAPGPARVRASC